MVGCAMPVDPRAGKLQGSHARTEVRGAYAGAQP